VRRSGKISHRLPHQRRFAYLTRPGEDLQKARRRLQPGGERGELGSLEHFYILLKVMSNFTQCFWHQPRSRRWQQTAGGGLETTQQNLA
jgi:hypothetical protein